MNIFGMFIHWGGYSQYGLHEQALARYDMQNDEYEKKMMEFNPVKYDPEQWVLLAKNAGMKYICITAKHHDGFCMWDTKYTDYNIMNTKYGKDVLKMLSEACRKHDVKLSIYYSCPDWHYEYGYNPNASHQWKSPHKDKADTVKYREYVKNQITELLTNYGEIYTLFWDIPPKIEDRSINELARMLQPGIYINNRGYDEGDFSTPEREDTDVSGITHFNKMTEACNAVGEQSWGYRANEDYHSIRYLTCSIDHIMAMGGSYLLNIGPAPDGSVDEKSRSIIERVGKWYNRMEGSLENVEADDFDYEIWYNKCIVNKKEGKSYFNFYNGIYSSAVCMKKYPKLPRKVRLLNTGSELSFEEAFLPAFFDETGRCEGKMLHITDIPVDSLENEPIVIEIEW